MADETLNEITEQDLEVDSKIIISFTSGSKTKLLLTTNLQGELDFFERHFSVPRAKNVDKEIKIRVERIVNEYINPKKNSIKHIELIRKNKHNIKKFILDCLVSVENDKENSNKREKFLSTDEITKTSQRKSLSVINMLVYFTENKK